MRATASRSPFHDRRVPIRHRPYHPRPSAKSAPYAVLASVCVLALSVWRAWGGVAPSGAPVPGASTAGPAARLAAAAPRQGPPLRPAHGWCLARSPARVSAMATHRCVMPPGASARRLAARPRGMAPCRPPPGRPPPTPSAALRKSQSGKTTGSCC